ncbi:MAG: hypothetical protein AAF316_00860 [Cyanobacteria bacterium P01_A01_bin.80]
MAFRIGFVGTYLLIGIYLLAGIYQLNRGIKPHPTQVVCLALE